MQDYEILDEHILYQQGSFRRIRRWVKGWHPTLGYLIWGVTGQETMIECSVISPQIIYKVN